MRKTPVLIALVLSSLLLAGCATASTPPAPVVTMATAATTNGAPAAAPDTSPSACTSNTCLTKQIQHDLLSVIAKDGAVITKAACRASTLKHNAGGTTTVYCKVTESDGAVSEGYANLIPAQDEITWDPTDVITAPGG
jgi:hypothetical protein